jgi:hypothetical protein
MVAGLVIEETTWTPPTWRRTKQKNLLGHVGRPKLRECILQEPDVWGHGRHDLLRLIANRGRPSPFSDTSNR